MRLRPLCGLLGLGLLLGVGRATAEPMFISRQYTHCTTCHYSPTGGGLLTPYGRSLSRQELSTTGASAPGTPAAQNHEQAFLWGALGDTLHHADVGIDIRPAHLDFDIGGRSMTRDLLMTADVLAAYRVNAWTVYGEIGREPLAAGAKIDSYEYWVAHQSASGLGLRVGRFLPAYGVRFADHTAFTRSYLGFDKYDQVYALEISHTGERHLLEVSAGPGFADSVLHDDGRQAFTATARFQLDLSPRRTLVVSGLFRDASRLEARNGAGGAAFGFAPIRRLSLWAEADAQFRQGSPGAPAFSLLNETSLEVYRGVWLKFSPQLRTGYGQTSAGIVRMAFDVDLLPRTHWNVEIHQAQVGLVDERRRLQRVARPLAAQAGSGLLPQVRVHGLDEAVGCVPVARPHRDQQPRDVFGRARHGELLEETPAVSHEFPRRLEGSCPPRRRP